MNLALIGYTGFVGSNLERQNKFNAKYNTSNIEEIEGKEFDLVVCAGVRAEKWLANQQPIADLEAINSLINRLKTISTKKFVLISTVDVYSNTIDVDEETEINAEKLNPYGENRLFLEQSIKKLFPNYLIVRLPALFGKGLKKNFIYDLIHPVPGSFTEENFRKAKSFLNIGELQLLEKCYEQDAKGFFQLKTAEQENIKKLEMSLKKINLTSLMFTHKDSVFQFYYLENLWKDIQIALDNGLIQINFTTEPVAAWEVAKLCFGLDFDNKTDKSPVYYNIKTLFGNLYKSTNGYLYNKNQVISQLKEYLKL